MFYLWASLSHCLASSRGPSGGSAAGGPFSGSAPGGPFGGFAPRALAQNHFSFTIKMQFQTIVTFLTFLVSTAYAAIPRAINDNVNNGLNFGQRMRMPVPSRETIP
ncbi:hypothetical protein BDZ91DRAFT_844265 [Kalaharituber pfeilii]|nr:hypothetical protein BDZ91DRAFT_844265 [Kalaharituber pfeilii]